MTCWKVACLLLVVMRLAQPRCSFCEDKLCHDVSAERPIANRIMISCEESDKDILVSFIKRNNFTHLRSLTLKYPMLSTLDLNFFNNISNLNLSQNNLTSVDLEQISPTKFVNLSNNSIDKLEVFSNLIKLDMSYNLIKNLSLGILKKNKLFNLHIQNNIIKDISNFSSNTLKYIDLSYNKIELLGVGYCPSLKQLILNNNFINKVQSELYTVIPNIEILNLSSNNLIKLQNYSFNLTNLLQLDLRNNKITSLSQKCFLGLGRLQVLDISLNKIQIVSPGTFQYVNSLLHLVVSENKELSSQDFGLLLVTRRLKSIYASQTNQKKIPSSLTRSVRYLVLKFNNISQIQCGDLDSYPLLNSLNLANNEISYIEDDALGRLELLKSINLDDNLLNAVPHTLPNNLKYLYLRNNKITNISNTDFTGLQQLSELDLSFNMITAIKESSFMQLYSLENLNLSGNQIITIPSNLFSSLQNLKILGMSYLINVTDCNQPNCFPVPDCNKLQELDMKHSPILVRTFMKDLAALKTFEQLLKLDISSSNATNISIDLPTYLTRLNLLNIQDNGLNCTTMEQIFEWYQLKEIDKCKFLISEKHQTTEILKSDIKDNINTDNLKETSVRTFLNKNLTDKNSSNCKENKTETKEYLYFDNKSDIFNAIEPEILSSEIWFNGTPIVDAFSSETPSSHPGLFVLLLFPIALVSTCLFLNYSRLKRNQHHHLVSTEMDIEISNISSELW